MSSRPSTWSACACVNTTASRCFIPERRACSRKSGVVSITMFLPACATGAKFERLVAIMAQLRAPNGCPWDREQNFDSIKKYTLEETYEVLDAIDRRDWPELRDELGDFLLQAVFYAQMASEEKHFD